MVMLAAAAGYGEEIQTRKTIKMASAVGVKNEMESRTDEPPVNMLTQGASIVQASTAVEKAELTTIKVEPITDMSSDSSSSSSFVSESTLPVSLESTSEPISSSTVLELSNSEGPNVVSPPDESPDDESEPDINNIIPLSEAPKRKVVYINQQQNGKLNVHLELSDVSVIVIPNQKDPQLSLLSLLLKSAQKSNAQNEAKKKEVLPLVDQHIDYSKYTRRNDEHVGAGIMPFIESRAPYKVDISSTLVQQPAVEIVPNSHQYSSDSENQFQPQFARSRIMQLLKPASYVLQAASGQAVPSNRIVKRSIDSKLLDGEITDDAENYVHYKDDILTDSKYNLLDNGDVSDDDTNDSEFILLGATENCGPGRKRNSYQVCVSVSDN